MNQALATRNHSPTVPEFQRQQTNQEKYDSNKSNNFSKYTYD